MGLLGKLFGKKEDESVKVIGSPLRGNVIPLSDVADPVFSEGMMGPGVGIIPEEGKLCSPINGEITVAFHTGHAVGLKTMDNMDVLIHIGIDTVKMNGDGFELHVKEGDKVKKGDLLISFDVDKIKSCGYETTTMIVVSNADEFGKMINETSGPVKVGDNLFSIG